MGFYQSIREVCTGGQWCILPPRGKEDNESYKTLVHNLRELVTEIDKTIREKGLDWCYNRAAGEGIAYAFSNHIRGCVQGEAVSRHMDGIYFGFLQSLEGFVEIIPDEIEGVFL
jgi:hypothetical protein